MRFQGEEKELFRLGANKKGDFYVFLFHPNPLPGFSPLERHVSYHASGAHHQKVSIRGRQSRKVGGLKLQPTKDLQGVELLTPPPLYKGQFQTLRPLRPSHKGVILLDADAARFSDDAIFFRVYLVEPDQESRIPLPSDVGPRILHIEKATIPWIVVEAFQQTPPLQPAVQNP